MPFTFAHPAIVLPFKYLPKRLFSLTALVIGSITPDFEYFIRMKVKSIYSHTWFGLLWFDLPLGILILLAFESFIKKPLIANLPLCLNRRFVACKQLVGYSAYRFIIIIISILIGAFSHILWDNFTHPAGYFVKSFPVLSNSFYLGSYRFPIYNIIQHLSTLIGLSITALTIFLLPQTNKRLNNEKYRFWLIVFGCCIITLSANLLLGVKLNQYGNLVVIAISGMLIGLIPASLLIRSAKPKPPIT